jgi:uncharacterized protein
MKLHLTHAEGNQLITAYAKGSVSINHQAYLTSLIVLPKEIKTDWIVSNFDALTFHDFEFIAALAPELVILGTGETHRFIHPKLSSPLTKLGIAVDCMTTDAACRTYNILMSEGRNVAAALIL